MSTPQLEFFGIIFFFLHFCSRLREQASPLNPKYSPFYSGVFVASAAASAGAECAGFSARCPRRVHATAVPHALLRARDVWDACAALNRRDLAIGARYPPRRAAACSVWGGDWRRQKCKPRPWHLFEKRKARKFPGISGSPSGRVRATPLVANKDARLLCHRGLWRPEAWR